MQRPSWWFKRKPRHYRLKAEGAIFGVYTAPRSVWFRIARWFRLTKT